MAQLVEQRIRNAQVVGSSPTISSKTCVNTAFSQVYSFSEMHFKIQYAIKNLTLFYGVRFCSLIRFFAQDHLLTIYELILFLVRFITNLFHSFGCSKFTIWAVFFIFINSLCGAFKLSYQFCVACFGQIIHLYPALKSTAWNSLQNPLKSRRFSFQKS